MRQGQQEKAIGQEFYVVEPQDARVIGGLQLLITNTGSLPSAPKAAANKAQSDPRINKSVFSIPLATKDELLSASANSLNSRQMTDEAHRKLNRVNRVKQLLGTSTKIDFDQDGKTIKVKTIEDNLNLKAISDKNILEIEKAQQL